jgi:hypothetical protein
MNSSNHPRSSAHYIPQGSEIGKTMSYVLRSNHPTVQVLRALVQGQLENILDVVAEDRNMRAMVFAYTVQEKLSRRQSERMRRFLW